MNEFASMGVRLRFGSPLQMKPRLFPWNLSLLQVANRLAHNMNLKPKWHHDDLPEPFSEIWRYVRARCLYAVFI
jgi:hypothetical protein